MMTLAKKYEDPGIDIDNFDKEAEIAKFDDYPMPLWNILIRLYTTPKKTTGGLIIPDTMHDNQKYHGITGLVIKIAPGAYKDERYKDTGPACKVGDWVVIARHSGIRMEYEGLPIFVVKEDAIELLIDDPRKITR